MLACCLGGGLQLGQACRFLRSVLANTLFPLGLTRFPFPLQGSATFRLAALLLDFGGGQLSRRADFHAFIVADPALRMGRSHGDNKTEDKEKTDLVHFASPPSRSSATVC